MDKRIFLLQRIEGEYAYLRAEDNGEELFIALALLPLGADVGDRLAYEFPDFTLL